MLSHPGRSATSQTMNCTILLMWHLTFSARRVDPVGGGSWNTFSQLAEVVGCNDRPCFPAQCTLWRYVWKSEDQRKTRQRGCRLSEWPAMHCHMFSTSRHSSRVNRFELRKIISLWTVKKRITAEKRRIRTHLIGKHYLLCFTSDAHKIRLR